MLPFALAKGLRRTFVHLGRFLLVCHSQPGHCVACKSQAAQLVATANTGSGEIVMKFSLEISSARI